MGEIDSAYVRRRKKEGATEGRRDKNPRDANTQAVHSEGSGPASAVHSDPSVPFFPTSLKVKYTFFFLKYN